MNEISLKMGILGVIYNRHTSGYQVSKVFDKLKGIVYSGTQGQIYNYIKDMGKSGLIEEIVDQANSGRSDKKVYAITKKGEIEFKEWLHAFPDTLYPEQKDEFLLRLLLGGRDITHSEMKTQLQRFIKERESDVQKQPYVKKYIEEYWGEEFSHNEKLFYSFIIKRNYLINELLIKWANECIEELNY